MADQWLQPDDWKRIQSPDGKVFYFNSTTNQTSWEPPTSPPVSGTNATTLIQNLSPPPPYQGIYGQATSQTTPNYSSYPQNPTSPNTGFYVPPPNNPPYDASPPPHPQYAAPPATNPHYSPPPPAPQGYRSPPAPPAGSPYPQQRQPYGQDSSRHSTSLRSLLGSAVKAAISPGQFNPSPYGNSGYPQAPVPNATYPTAGMMPSPAPSSAGQVIVNQQPLDQQSLLRLQMMGVRIVPGRYWYDPRCGAWGQESGPCLGAIAAGQSLGGPLRADASGPSTTGVFINGRQIHALDAFRLQAMGITPIPGRWWVAADGRYGLEGTFVALGTLAPHGMASKGAGSNSWSWSNGDSFGGQGDGFGYVGGTDSTGRSWCVDYGT